MQRYLQENDLRKQNIRCFDAWAKTFGKVTNSFEISVDGSGFVNRSRFCKFFNMEELMNHFRQVAEIQTAGMLRKSLEESVLGRVKAVPPKHIGVNRPLLPLSQVMYWKTTSVKLLNVPKAFIMEMWIRISTICLRLHQTVKKQVLICV